MLENTGFRCFLKVCCLHLYGGHKSAAHFLKCTNIACIHIDAVVRCGKLVRDTALRFWNEKAKRPTERRVFLFENLLACCKVVPSSGRGSSSGANGGGMGNLKLKEVLRSRLTYSVEEAQCEVEITPTVSIDSQNRNTCA